MDRMDKRILILHSGALGDFIATLPVLSALRRQQPDAWLEVLARGRHAALAEGIANKTGDIELCGAHELFAAGGAPAASTFSHYISSFDFVISWLGYEFSAGKGPCVTNVPPTPAEGQPASQFFFKCIPLLAADEFVPPRVTVLPIEDQQAEELLARHGVAGQRPLAALHPGSGGPRKCWPAARFAQVAASLLQHGWQVLMIEGEADRVPVGQVLAAMESAALKPAAVMRNLPLRLLAAVLGRCRAYLGNDSGISHLAAAAGTRCRVIFGPTDPAVWAPVGENVEVLTANIPCRPCRQTRPECDHLGCLAGVSAHRVVRAMLRTAAHERA